MRQTPLFVLVLIAAMAIAGQAAHSALLISEVFDYDSGTLAGASGGAGWATPWSVAAYPTGATGAIEISDGSLVFSDYPSSGNKLSLSLDTIPGFVGPTATRFVSESITGGDMWVSYLYRRTDASIGTNTSRIADLRFNDGAIHFGSQVKVSGSQGIATRYEGSGGPTAATTSVQDGEVYMVVSKFANLGTGPDATTTATMWALNAAGYDSIKAGGLLESEVDSAAVLKATDTSSSAEVLTALTDKIELVIASSAAPFSFAFDEIRVGTTLASVIAIPEPASVVLLCLTAVFSLFGRTRRYLGAHY